MPADPRDQGDSLTPCNPRVMSHARSHHVYTRNTTFPSGAKGQKERYTEKADRQEQENENGTNREKQAKHFTSHSSGPPVTQGLECGTHRLRQQKEEEMIVRKRVSTFCPRKGFEGRE